METPFKTLAELGERLQSTKKRLFMIDLTADFLVSLQPQEVEPAVSMILGRPFPKWSPQTLDVSWVTLSQTIKKVAGIEWNLFHEAVGKSDDLGSATKIVLENRLLRHQTRLFEKPLTLMEVRRSLEHIAETVGQGSREKKERLVGALLSRSTPLEAKYLVKILIGEVRTGFHEGLMEQAVAKAFQIPLKKVQEASMVTGDIGEVAGIIRIKGKQGLTRIGFKVFRPVTLMLAQMAANVGQALKEHGGKTALEFKYDGARIQIHKLRDEVKIYSRRLTDVTDSMPEILRAAKDGVTADEAILEGEVIAIDNSGFPIPFQHLMRRFRRVHAVEEMVGKIPIKLYLFDILYLNGKSMVSVPYLQRRQILSENVDDIPLTSQITTNKIEEAEKFLKEALDAGHEGLMAKKLDSPYTPGFRKKHWLKIKPILQPLDLVIVAAEYGYGRRHGWLSDYYLAAREVETGKYLPVGKTFKGLTDAEIIDLTSRLKELSVKKEHGRVTVIPKIVVEVAYNEIQRSPKYECQMALRFARITRIRNDKSPEEADTIQTVREIYEKQFLKKGRYGID